MINFIKTKIQVYKAEYAAKKSRKLYENRNLNYTRIATDDELKNIPHMEYVRSTYLKERAKSIDANVFFDKKKTPYVIVNHIRYNLSDTIDRKGTFVAQYLLYSGDIVIQPLQEFIRTGEQCYVVGLLKTPDTKFKSAYNPTYKTFDSKGVYEYNVFNFNPFE